MAPQKTLMTNLIGTGMVALCCFTPILVMLLGALGLEALVSYLDAVLLPVLGAMMGLTVLSYGRYRRHCRDSKRGGAP
jgi:mercuric ion transport protein